MRVFLLIYVVFLTALVFWWKTSSLPTRLPPMHNQLIWREADDTKFLRTPEARDARLPIPTNDHYINFFLQDPESFCDGNFIGYKNLFAKVKNVILDTQYGHGRKGGENISEVLNQDESEEFYRFHSGFFKLPCTEELRYVFGIESHLTSWVGAIHTQPSTVDYKPYSQWTIAITRYEYANLYHGMTDFYNAFMMMKVFGLRPDNVTILFVDGHPHGALDDAWNTLFNRVTRVGELTQPVMFENMVWSIVGYDSPLDEHDLPAVSFLEEFRHFFLSKYGVQTDYEAHCDKLNVVLLWRHDYLAHPRNPTGKVSRKIKNEEELLEKIMLVFQGHNVQGLQLDLFPMRKQLDIIAHTDILIGMHGAGLSHTMFLPRHAGLIEMYPLYYSSENRHFRKMAEWRHIHYLSWEHLEPERDFNDEYTLVDVNEIARYAQQMFKSICGKVS